MITAEELDGAAWHKSSQSGSNSGCVSVATIRDYCAVRDSKNIDGPAIIVSRAAWAKFISLIKRDELVPRSPDASASSQSLREMDDSKNILP